MVYKRKLPSALICCVSTVTNDSWGSSSFSMVQIQLTIGRFFGCCIMAFGQDREVRSKVSTLMFNEKNGIASLLLPGGRMARSRFLIFITITGESTCNIKHDSLKTELLIQSTLIIWDEAPMLNKMCFKALDQTLADLKSVTDQYKIHQLFGGKIVVLRGDFRQIIPVIPKGSRHDILSSAINSSHIWSFCKIHDVENRNIGSAIDDESEVEVPNDLLIVTIDNLLSQLNQPVTSPVQLAVSKWFFDQGLLAMDQNVFITGSRLNRFD
ncbi:uncharacterized protein LOC110280606 [Arachis duranensis]|uniref:ATP-dependent DNA helicase n=1 Tax=Arachis duranensis TaxID=130453 RepID=A0A6P5NQQ2_ARADU|nr:uncharacterized protein LOC110280606 [Arachis duranensis]